MLLFTTARLDKTLVTILSYLNTAVSCKIRVHASIGRLIFTLSSSVCDSRNLYREFLFCVFPVFSGLTLAV